MHLELTEVLQSGLAELRRYQTILTPNRRLARALNDWFAAQQTRRGEKVWQPLRTVAITDWLQELWQQGMFKGVESCTRRYILSEAEEREIWRQAVAQESRPLLHPDTAIEQLASAWKMLCDWSVDLDDPALRARFSYREDSEFFLRCQRRFVNACDDLGAISAACLANELSKLEPLASDPILLFACDELVPAQTQLFLAWSISTDSLDALSDTDRFVPSEIFGYESEQHEMFAAALWAVEQIRAAPQATTAVVIPDLSARQEEVRFVFDRVFGQYSDTSGRSLKGAFNITAGRSLASVPLISAAINLLELVVRELPVQNLPELLYSPFFAHHASDSSSALSDLEFNLRQLASARLTTGDIHFAATRQQHGHGAGSILCPRLAQIMQAILTASRFKEQRFEAWLEVISELLNSVGWPGPATLNSTEYQQLEAWLELLETASQLAAVRFGKQAKVNFSQALGVIKDLCANQVFQSQNVEQPVQVLGYLEAAGMHFDSVRLVGLSESSWPAAARPSPFIPWEMQVHLTMPHCDARREEEFAKRLLQGFKQRCDEIVISCAASDDGSTPKVSPLINGQLVLKDIDSNLLGTVKGCWLTDYVSDDQSLSVQVGETIRGGVAILENQGLCPFKAFAKHRCKIRTFDEPVLGLDGRDRGQMLHQVMETVWGNLGSQEALNNCPVDKLTALVNQAIEDSVGQLKKRLRARKIEALIDLEAARMRSVVQAWLEAEQQRLPFSIVELEQLQETTIANVPIQYRLDRVDRLQDGKLIVIEYKTGVIQPARLLDDRLTTPQLPFYMTRYTHEALGAPAGAALCRLGADELSWIGLAAAQEVDMPLQKKRLPRGLQAEEMEERIDQWRIQLQLLEQEFATGHAAITPYRGLQTCRNCDFSAVCRYAVN